MQQEKAKNKEQTIEKEELSIQNSKLIHHVLYRTLVLNRATCYNFVVNEYVQ